MFGKFPGERIMEIIKLIIAILTAFKLLLGIVREIIELKKTNRN